MTKEDNNLTPYEVFEGSAWEAGLLKSILEDNQIETYISQAVMLPWNNLPLKGAAAKVYVALQDFEQAKAIVDEFYSNMIEESPDQ